MVLCLREHDLDWREVGDEIVALDRKGGLYLGARGSGAVIWGRLAESTTHEDLVQTLVATYGIEEARAAVDVDEFLTALRERDLLAE